MHAGKQGSQLLPAGLHIDRHVVLPDESNDDDRHLLPDRPDANRPQQEPVQAYRAHPARQSMLRLRHDPFGQRRVLRIRQSHIGRYLLQRPGQSEESCELSNPDAGLRARLHQGR